MAYIVIVYAQNGVGLSCTYIYLMGDMISICRSKTKYQIVLTKTDVVFPIDVARRAMQIEEVMIDHSN